MNVTKEMIERGIRALAKTHWQEPRAERDPEKALDAFIKHRRPVFQREVEAVLNAALGECSGRA